jgi:hypothetical protein
MFSTVNINLIIRGHIYLFKLSCKTYKFYFLVHKRIYKLKPIGSITLEYRGEFFAKHNGLFRLAW